jgi:RimJ/RimL family protein N-acetyltransferase
VYEALIDNTIVNHAELHRFNYLLRQLGFGVINVIGDCETVPEYQGQGIYPAMLSRIIRDVKQGVKANSPLFIMVVPENIPSIKGIERAGFQFAFHIQVTRLGPFLIQKTLGNSK